MGKIIGGGLPVGAYGGKKEIMELLSPLGGVYQAGTLSGNPLALAAGIATLDELRKKEIYKTLEENTKKLVSELKGIFDEFNVPCTINSIASMFTIFYTKNPVHDYESAKKTDTKLFTKIFNCLLAEGVYLPCSNFETCFLSITHNAHDIKLTGEKFYNSLKLLIK